MKSLGVRRHGQHGRPCTKVGVARVRRLGRQVRYINLSHQLGPRNSQSNGCRSGEKLSQVLVFLAQTSNSP